MFVLTVGERALLAPKSGRKRLVVMTVLLDKHPRGRRLGEKSVLRKAMISQKPGIVQNASATQSRVERIPGQVQWALGMLSCVVDPTILIFLIDDLFDWEFCTFGYFARIAP
jgi:hypothetical protein